MGLQKITSIKKEVVKLTLLRFPTESYKKAYGSFEQYLRIRTVVFMTCKNIIFLLSLMLGTEHLVIAENLIEKVDQKG